MIFCKETSCVWHSTKYDDICDKEDIYIISKECQYFEETE